MENLDEQKSTIMIVDDTPDNLRLLSRLLQDGGYGVLAFPRGKMALHAALQRMPDLVLLDINMPEMDGYAVCTAFKQEPTLQDIPIIFLSALNDPDDKVKAFKHGGVDFITKPFQMEEVYARVATHLQLHQARKLLTQYNERLQGLVAEQIKEINKSQLAMIFALAKLSHTRDDDTGMHLERVQHLCLKLAEHLQAEASFSEEIDEVFLETIYHASPLHDVGKVGIADSILLKPGKLTEEEFAIMKTHTTIGAQTLETVYSHYPGNLFIKMGIEIATSHHERWNGAGYPHGLSGENIPLSARIMALVDVYEALRAKRPYKESFPHEKSCSIIQQESGKMFDPRIVKIFITVEAEINSLYTGMIDF